WSSGDECRLDPPRGLQCFDDARRSANMVVVRMRQNECRDFATASTKVRHHHASPGISAAPRTACVHDDPPATRRTQCNGIALPDVDHVQFDLATAASKYGTPDSKDQ